jgi:hypothetical protein
MDFMLGQHGPRAAFVSGLTTELLPLGDLLGRAGVAGPSLDGGLEELRELRLTRSFSRLTPHQLLNQLVASGHRLGQLGG